MSVLGDLVAGYGAFVATGVAIRQWHTDRLRVKVGFAYEQGEALILRIVNDSRRVVYIDYVAIMASRRDRHLLPFDYAFNVMVDKQRTFTAIEPGNRLERRMSADTLRMHLRDDRRWVRVDSASGRSYSPKRIPDHVIQGVIGTTLGENPAAPPDGPSTI